MFNWRYPSCLYRRVTGRNVPGGCTFTITRWSRFENFVSKSWMFSMQQSTIGKPYFLSPWCNRGWDGQPDFALLNRQLREVGQPHLWVIIRRSGFCETFLQTLTLAPAPGGRCPSLIWKMSGVSSVSKIEVFCCSKPFSYSASASCFSWTLRDTISDGTKLNYIGGPKKLQLEIKISSRVGTFPNPPLPARFEII